MSHKNLNLSLSNISIVFASCSLSIVLSSGNGLWARNVTSSGETVAEQEISQLFQPPDAQAPKDTTGGASRGQEHLFAPPADSSAPIETSSGASRGDELEMPQTVAATRETLATLKAVMPPTNYGQTISGRPTFFLYVPEQAVNGTKQVFFSLQDQTQDYFYQTRIDLPAGSGGIISFPLPEDAEELAEGVTYKWFVTVMDKGERLRADTSGVTGWVERIQPTQALDQNSPATVELALSYAEAGLWYDTVETFVELKQAQSEDNTLANYWETLLTEVGLEAISSQPIMKLPSTSPPGSAN